MGGNNDDDASGSRPGYVGIHASRDSDDPCAPAKRLSRLVEREWSFEPCHSGKTHVSEVDDDDYACAPIGREPGICGGSEGGGNHDGDRRGGGRPARPSGQSNGRLREGRPLNRHDINHPTPAGVFVGTRDEMDLPYLFMRANAADIGARPITNAPFWESPDIFLLAGVTPALAPDVPSQLGQVALAGEPNTIYAHIWNFGKASSNELVVEFYWCDPSLGITASNVQLIAQITTSLGHKGSGNCHKLVKCPEPWSPAFVNGGHECLLVRVWDNPADFPGEPAFDASQNRHVAQRNIHVQPIAGEMPTQPLIIRVGALFGAPAEVRVERVAPHAMPWLQLRTGMRGVFPAAAPPTGHARLSPPTGGGTGFSAGGAASQHVLGDDQRIAFSTSDAPPGGGEAHVYRVSARQDGDVFGGYTVVVLG